MQEEETKHIANVVCHQQKVQHHEYEHEQTIESVQQQGQLIMKAEEDKHVENEVTNRNSKQTQKEDYEREDHANISEIEQTTKEQQAELQQLQQRLEQQKESLIKENEGKLVTLEKELSLRMKVEIHEIEERKN